MDDPAGVPPSVPNEEPSVAPLPTFGSNPKIELPQVPPLPEESKPPLDDSSQIPVIEVIDKPPEVKNEPVEPQKPAVPAPEPFLVPPRPVGDSEKISSPPKTDFSVTTTPPSPAEVRKKSGKSVVLGLIAIFVIAGGVLGYYFFQKGGLPFNLEKKAEETIDSCADGAGGCCDGDLGDSDGCGCRASFHETCSIGNGACTSGLSCGAIACKPEGTCSGNWECCSGNCSNGVCVASQPPPSTGEPPTCSVTLIPGGSDGICIKADGAQLTATACLNDINCVNGNRSVSYNRTVANCSEPSCNGVCGNAGEQRTLTVPAGQLCVEETVSCAVTNKCGNCQVDINGYGERAWQDSGCITPIAPSPSPIPSLTVIPPSPTLTQTPISAACSAVSVKAVNVNSNAPVNLNDLKVGDVVYFLVDLSGTVEDVAVDLRKNGVSLRTFYASQTASSSWRTPDYTIAATGLYEVAAFVKINGVWK